MRGGSLLLSSLLVGSIGCAVRPSADVASDEAAVTAPQGRLNDVVFSRNWRAFNGTRTTLTFARTDDATYTATLETATDDLLLGREVVETRIIGSDLGCDFPNGEVACTAGPRGVPSGATLFRVLVKRSGVGDRYFDAWTRTEKGSLSREELVAEDIHPGR